ncbi:unnamed protein product, partial [Iphiclides podalirius]
MLGTINIIITLTLICSLLLVDYSLGNGLLQIVLRYSCRAVCYVRTVIREEAKRMVTDNETPMNIPVLISEVLFLTVLTVILNRYTQLKARDRIDDLLQQSRHRLRCTNEYLNRWRSKRANYDQSYLDEEPQQIEPLKLEIPILHMAIIDTRGPGRSQHERGDAGDSMSGNESTLVSVRSLYDDDSESLLEHAARAADETHVTDNTNRSLWNVQEEDLHELQE